MQSTVGVVLICFGFLGLGASGPEFMLRARLRQNGIITTGIVTRHLPRPDGVDQPVIQFTDRQGRLIEYSPIWASRKKFLPKGNQISVRYLANEPDKARLTGSETRRGSIVFGAALCAVFLGVGLQLTTDPSSQEAGTVDAGTPISWLFALVPMFGATFFAANAIHRTRALLALRREGVVTMGTVVRVFRDSGGDRQAVVEFFDSNHRRFQCVAWKRSRSSTAGTRISVIYRADSPEKAQSPSLKLFPRVVGLLLIGIYVFLFGLVVSGMLLFA